MAMAAVRLFSVYARANPRKIPILSKIVPPLVHRRSFPLPVISMQSFCSIFPGYIPGPGKKVEDYRMRLRIVTVVGGRTRMVDGGISSIQCQGKNTFIEVTDDPCSPSLQCAEISSDSRSYDQVGVSDPSFVIPKEMVSSSLSKPDGEIHFRPGIDRFCAVILVNDDLARDVYTYFEENGFVWKRRPVIAVAMSRADKWLNTSIWIPSSCEGTDSSANGIPLTKEDSKEKDLLKNHEEDCPVF